MANIPPGQRRLENSLRPPARGARLKGPADPSAVAWVEFVVRRRPDAPALPGPTHWMSIPLGRRKFLSGRNLPVNLALTPPSLKGSPSSRGTRA